MSTSDKINLGVAFLTLGAFALAYFHLRHADKAAKLDRSYQLIDRYFTYYADLNTGDGGVLPVEQLLERGSAAWIELETNNMKVRGFFKRLAKYFGCKIR
jgi:hypothetical protein